MQMANIVPTIETEMDGMCPFSSGVNLAVITQYPHLVPLL